MGMECGIEGTAKGWEQERETQVSQQEGRGGMGVPGAEGSLCKARRRGIDVPEMIFVIVHVYQVFVACQALIRALQLLNPNKHQTATEAPFPFREGSVTGLGTHRLLPPAGGRVGGETGPGQGCRPGRPEALHPLLSHPLCASVCSSGQ